jgi:hypothetical protein
MRFENLEPIGREAAGTMLSEGTQEEKVGALLRLTYHDPDREWLQSLCIDILHTSNDLWLRRTAITCIGHIARIHGNVDVKVVRPLLERLREDAELSGFVDDTLADLTTFLPRLKAD